MVTWTDSEAWREQGLTQGEEEGIEADLAAGGNLGDEPLSYAADGHWRRSHRTD